jgi:hypothetical protein
MSNKEFLQSKLEQYKQEMEAARQTGDYDTFEKRSRDVSNQTTMIKIYEAHSDD